MNEAVKCLVSGDVIIYPTETVFGLAVDPFNQIAVNKLLKIKGRECSAGISLIAVSEQNIKQLVDEKEGDEIKARRFALQKNFWPGPLTIVFKASSYAKSVIASGVFGPDDTLAVRVSSRTSASKLALLSPSGLITSTSANPKGLTPANSINEAKAYFPDFYILKNLENGQEANSHTPSTLIKATNLPFEIIREGAITKAELLDFIN